MMMSTTPTTAATYGTTTAPTATTSATAVATTVPTTIGTITAAVWTAIAAATRRIAAGGIVAGSKILRGRSVRFRLTLIGVGNFGILVLLGGGGGCGFFAF